MIAADQLEREEGPPLLRERLHAAGIDDVVELVPATGGLAATAGLARRADGSSLFVKAFDVAPSPDAFACEAEGLTALRTLGGVATPHVVAATADVLVLEALHPRPQDAAFWLRLADELAHLHTATDLAHVWTTAPPPEAGAFFDRYADLTALDAGWRERMPVLQLRQHLAVIAQFERDWGAADAVRTTLAPFRRTP